MKKILFIVLAFCFMINYGWAQQCSDDQLARLHIVGGGVPAAASADCPTGTYSFAWNGDYTGDTDKACSGAVAEDGSVVGDIAIGTDYGQGGSVGILINAADEGITWTETLANSGTIWVDFYVSSIDADTMIFEWSDGTNTDGVNARIRSSGTFRGGPIWNATTGYATSAGGVNNPGWNRAGISWSTGAVASVKLNAEDWVDAGTSKQDFADTPTEFNLGERDFSVFNGAIYIDHIYYIANSVEAAYPGP